jgi:hypothetical protein
MPPACRAATSHSLPLVHLHPLSRAMSFIVQIFDRIAATGYA